MDWTQVWTIVGANLGLAIVCVGATITLFLWARSEANQDRRQIAEILREMKDEMKDFHGRLCAIEERNKKEEKS